MEINKKETQSNGLRRIPTNEMMSQTKENSNTRMALD